MNLYGLPDITFAEKDPAVIASSIISGFERAHAEATGEVVTLYPGDPRRLLLSSIAAVIVQLLNLIDYTGKQNLLAYADGDKLEHIGLLLGVYRLLATAARTTIRFNLSTALTSSYIIPAGTRCTPDGTLYFTTIEAAEVPPGAMHIEVSAICLQSGDAGNGYLAGQIKTLVDPLPWVESIVNTTVSSGGSATEDDETLRERIHIAPESFSVAGPRGAYEYAIKSIGAPIIDASIVGPPEIKPGHVEIYPLMEGGEIPTQDILDLAYRACSAEDVRPLTDFVSVHAPEAVPYSLVLQYWIERKNATTADLIHNRVRAAVNEWVLWQRSKIGRDVTPSKLIQLVMDAGAKRVEVLSPDYQELIYKELAVPEHQPEIVFGGLEDD